MRDRIWFRGEARRRGGVLDGAERIGEPAAGQSGPASGDLGGVVLSWIWLGIVLISVLWAALVSGTERARYLSPLDPSGWLDLPEH